MIKPVLFCFLLILLFNSCAKDNQNEAIVYNNDFESGSLANIQNGNVVAFNGTKVLGTFNNSGFELSLNDLAKHDLIDVTFDLYIHDSWEGNQQLNSENGPDIWQLKIDDKTYINTTFSNNDCLPGNYCPPQSYPADYPSNNSNPKNGALSVDLPGFCSQAANPHGTTLYRIHKSISHSEKTILIQCLDKLVQKNSADPKCDESWSVDNIKIKLINLN